MMYRDDNSGSDTNLIGKAIQRLNKLMEKEEKHLKDLLIT